eukprot:1161617-Pelagomonas_calceolata.AAC.8
MDRAQGTQEPWTVPKEHKSQGRATSHSNSSHKTPDTRGSSRARLSSRIHSLQRQWCTLDACILTCCHPHHHLMPSSQASPEVSLMIIITSCHPHKHLLTPHS